MIKIITTGFFNKYQSGNRINSYKTKIISIYKCYNQLFNVEIYQQIINQQTTAVICKFGADLIIDEITCVNKTEILEFIMCIGCKIVLCSSNLTLKAPCRIGKVLQYKTNGESKNSIPLSSEQIKNVYMILRANMSVDFSVPVYEDFYTDISHKVRHSNGYVFAVKHNDIYISTAIITAVAPKSAIISMVATLPSYKRMGYGKQAVNSALSSSVLQNKNIYLFCDKKENQLFYENIGFTQAEGYAEYIF